MSDYFVTIVLRDKMGNMHEIRFVALGYDHAESIVKHYMNRKRRRLVRASISIIYGLEEK